MAASTCMLHAIVSSKPLSHQFPLLPKTKLWNCGNMQELSDTILDFLRKQQTGDLNGPAWAESPTTQVYDLV
jgi:hypothetical protein